MGKLMRKKIKSGFLKSEGGAAAVETVFILPFMCVLYFGSADLTSLIKFNKQMTDVATTVADTVAQYKTSITRAQVTDIENTIGLLIQPNQAANVQVDVYDYYLAGATSTSAGTVTKRWSTKSPNGTSCAAPSTTYYASMMGPTGGPYNDVIVAVSCMSYTPWVGQFMGSTNLLGAASFTLTQSIASVPYASKTVSCYSSGTTLCNG